MSGAFDHRQEDLAIKRELNPADEVWSAEDDEYYARLGDVWLELDRNKDGIKVTEVIDYDTDRPATLDYMAAVLYTADLVEPYTAPAWVTNGIREWMRMNGRG